MIPHPRSSEGHCLQAVAVLGLAFPGEAPLVPAVPVGGARVPRIIRVHHADHPAALSSLGANLGLSKALLAGGSAASRAPAPVSPVAADRSAV